MSDIKTLKQYYIDNPCSLNVENYISQLEQHNKEMFEMIKLLSVALDKTNKILGIKIKTLTEESIDEVIK